MDQNNLDAKFQEDLQSLSTSKNAVTGLKKDIQQIAPLAREYNGAQTVVAPYMKSTRYSSGNWGLDFLKSSANIISTGADTAFNYVKNTPVDIYNDMQPFLQGVASMVTNELGADLNNVKAQQKQLDEISAKYDSLYKSGDMDKEQYIRLKKDIADSYQNLSKKSQNIENEAIQAGDPKKVIISAAQTAAVIFSVGKLQSMSVRALPAVTNTSISAVNKAAINLEKAIQNVPAIRELMFRNVNKFAATQNMTRMIGETGAQALARNSKDLAVGILFKRPVIYQTNIDLATETFEDIVNKQFDFVNAEGDQGALADAAWIGLMALGGGPVKWILDNGKNVTKALSRYSKGVPSFIDEVSARIGNGDRTVIGKMIADGKLDKDMWEKFAAINLHMTHGDNTRAVTNFLANISEASDMTKVTPEYLQKTMNNWAKADDIAQSLSKMHFPDERVKYVAVRWDENTKYNYAKQIATVINESNGDAQAIVRKTVEILDNADFGQNEALRAKLLKPLATGITADDYIKYVKKIRTSSKVIKDMPEGMAKKLKTTGYILAEPKRGRITPVTGEYDIKKLVTEVDANPGLFDEAVAPMPLVSSFASGLRRFGLSPEENTRIAYDKLSESLEKNISELGVSSAVGLKENGGSQRGAKLIISRLQNYINEHQPARSLNWTTFNKNQQSALQDIRQLRTRDLQEALGIKDVKVLDSIRQAINKAYTDVPLEFRGLGIKAFDYAYRVPGARNYFRAQSALRYTYNPFFRAQEIVETKIFSHMKANNLVWAKGKAELDDAWSKIDDSKLFTSGYTGEATQDLTLGRLHANILPTQKRDLAGLALAIAKKKGVTLEHLLATNPDEVGDALKVIVQYPSKGILNSPLARTLNIAFFPMRYNIKVAGMVAQEVAKLPPTVQMAVVNSTLRFSEWAQSPEGIQWQSENSDAIQVFKYFTPYGNIESVLHLLNKTRKGEKIDSVSELGLLGGLPFGFISQLLDSTGVFQLDTPYVNPKTGEVLPDYIPETTKAKAAVALQTLIGSVFTYPGRIIGLPGKTTKVRELVDIAIQTNSDEYYKNIRTEDLTPLQQKWVNIINNRDNITQDMVDELYNSAAPGAFQGHTLPTFPAEILDLPEAKIKTSNKIPRVKTAPPIDQQQPL